MHDYKEDMTMVMTSNGTTFIPSGEGGATINTPYTTRENIDLEPFSLDPNAFGDFTLIQ